MSELYYGVYFILLYFILNPSFLVSVKCKAFP